MDKKEHPKSEDISKLYSSLQAVIDKPLPNNSEAKFVPLPPSLPLSPSSSSPITQLKPIATPTSLSTPRDSNLDCPCQKVIDKKNLRVCALCRSPIPVIEELLSEQKNHENEIILLGKQLKQEQNRIGEQLNSIKELNLRLEKVTMDLDDKTIQFQALQSDMELLNEKYVDEIERVAEIQHSKDMVESELEDLSRRLFEEANGMVANEKREKHNLEMAHKHLENQLQETRDRLAAEQMQLKELRKKMEEMAENSCSYNAFTKNTKATQDQQTTDVANLLAEKMTAQLANSTTVEIDSLILEEFKVFVNAGTSIPLKKLHSIPFIKNCQDEDVEACLRFGSNSRLSARKISEAIVLNTCFIEESPVGFAEEQAQRLISENPLKISAAKSLMWERFSNNQITVFNGCQACGRSDGTALSYRFRISYFDDWACIDRFCRDRLVAVCEFYVLIRNIRQGLYSNRSLQQIYHEVMRLRLQMFYARMGALPWTLQIASAKRQVKVASSESSPLPKSTKTTDELPRRGSFNDVPTTAQESGEVEKEESIPISLANN
ncbi:hypothetical protein BY458DRAFT_458661 [Sporodiniella umbellata]|nr:hypothetical protein BY458DRAFT_458661 [Sporodiniella umbellata]